MINYDVLILCADKDRNKLSYVLDSLRFLTPNYNDVVIISQSKIDIWDITNVTDDQLPWDKSLIKVNSVNWIYQQLVKLLQPFTATNWLVIDSDTVILRPLEIIHEEKANLFFDETNNQFHENYFKFLALYGIQKNFPYSFINEIMFFNRLIVKDMFQYESYADICAKMEEGCYISEYEMYGNFLMQNNMFESYELKEISSNRLGKDTVWTDEEIQKAIADSDGHDLVTLHTWMQS